MNRIKSFYVSHLPALKLDQAFAWNASNLPAAFKPGSISYLLAVQVAILSGISLAAAVYYFGLLFQFALWVLAPGIGVLYFVAQMLVYRGVLREKRSR